MRKATFITAAWLLLSCAGVFAENVDLVTLPRRETVQLTIYNAEDLTLVKETRYLTLKKGVNRLQYSWAGTLIDPTSVELRALEHEDKIEIAHTVFPGQKPQHLIWHIESAYEGQAKVEVMYFTSGLTWSMDYVGITDPDEKTMRFKGYVRVYNNSGEEYEDAEVRLIVGKINLVEKIAELARRRGVPVPGPTTAPSEELRKQAAALAFAKADGRRMRPTKKAKQVIKEGVANTSCSRSKARRRSRTAGRNG